MILSFEGVDSRKDAALMRNAVLQIQENCLPALHENEYYHWQIIGLRVITAEGNEVGKVVEIMETRSNDVYVVWGSGREFLIPAIKDAVSSIDLDAGLIVINPIEGLLD